jgi:putative aldouronate transport system substrate-binding protein
MMYQWQQEGLIMPDATTSTASSSDLINVVGYANFENITPSKRAELIAGKYWDVEGVAVEVVSPFISSIGSGGAAYCIPTVCENPEKAMELLNLMYIDQEIADILTYGIEGRDFEYVEGSDRQVVRSIEGSTYGVIAWTWPNQAIASTMEGVNPDIWTQNNAFREAAAISPALTFKFDSSTVMNEITACNNVIAKYELGLRWGELNPAEALPEFNEELYAAGLQTIMDEKQKQLDAYLGQ